MNSIKGIIFDYGGTIDTNGTHWGEVIWDAYQATGVNVSKELFREAYIHGERTLAKEPIIKPEDTFHTLLKKKTAIQAVYLRDKEIDITACHQEAITKNCYNKVLQTLQTTCSIVEKLSQHYPMVLVTNFYGNMNVVLDEFKLKRFFPNIVESSVVGIRKPSPALFALGVEALDIPAPNIMVIGDSYRKDIYPALSLGCKAVWLKNRCWADEEIIPSYEPTAIIDTLDKIGNILPM